MYSCIIFDMDGTLTHTNELIFASFNHVLKKVHGTTLSPREIISLFGPPEEGALAKVFGQEMVEPVMQELLAYYAANHHTLAHLHEGMEELLQFLKRHGLRLAVFTGKGRHTTAITLDAFHLTSFFDFVVTGNDVERHKPDAEGIQKILTRFALEPKQALMVGDSMADLRAARSAGVPMAAVLWDSYDYERITQAHPDYLFHSVAEMEQWFRHHMNGKSESDAPRANDDRKG
jgi:HAD superfamily hydrolase (TIGR01509 family)